MPVGAGGPVFPIRSTLVSPCASVWTVTVPPAGRLCTMAFWTRFVTIRSRSSAEPLVRAAPPETSSVIRRFSARGSSVSAASSATRERSTTLAGEGAAVATAEQQEGLGEVDRPLVDGVQAFDEVAGVAAPGRCGRRRGASGRSPAGCAVRGRRWRRTAAAPRRGIRAVRASSRTRRRVRGTRLCGPPAGSGGTVTPPAATRVASVMRVSGASIRPARSHPPSRPNNSRKASTAAARGAKARSRSERFGTKMTGAPEAGRGAGGLPADHLGYVPQQEHPHGDQEQATRQHARTRHS